MSMKIDKKLLTELLAESEENLPKALAVRPKYMADQAYFRTKGRIALLEQLIELTDE